jgi:hypothetical protein
MRKLAFAILVIAGSTACKSSKLTDPPADPAPKAGVLSKGGGADFQSFFVVAAP